MRRRRGMGGGLISILSTLVIVGLCFAVLKQFNWDIGAAISWVGDKALSFINAVSDYFTSMPAFRNFFQG